MSKRRESPDFFDAQKHSILALPGHVNAHIQAALNVLAEGLGRSPTCFASRGICDWWTRSAGYDRQLKVHAEKIPFPARRGGDSRWLQRCELFRPGVQVEGWADPFPVPCPEPAQKQAESLVEQGECAKARITQARDDMGDECGEGRSCAL